MSFLLFLFLEAFLRMKIKGRQRLESAVINYKRIIDIAHKGQNKI